MFNMNANANNNNNEIRSQIDFNLLPKNCPSLCIPRVFSNIGEARIRKIFEDICIGRIEEIDIIKGNKNNRVFIHLTWNNTPDAQFVRNQVMTGKDVKIIYDEPWYWMISAARNQPPKPQPQPPQLLKTDEYGRELRQAQPTPLPKPILRRQVCFHEVPPPPPPAPLQRQKACFEPPRHDQLRHQEPRQEQQQTDQFGRDIRRPQPPPTPAPKPPAPTRPSGPTKTMQSWHLDEYDEDDEEYNRQELQKIKERVQQEQQREQQKEQEREQQMQKEQEFVPPPPPRFIPQSPTTTPPCLRRKQIQPEEDHQEPEDQEEEEEAPRAPPKLDVDEMSKPVVINYGSVLPIKKIRKSRRTVTM